MTAVALSNCVDKSQASFISPLHSLPLFSLSPQFSICVSLPHLLSLSEAKNNEVTPLSRTVPYKNSPVSRLLSSARSLLHPHPVLHATGPLLATPILGHVLCLQTCVPPSPPTSHIHTERFQSDPPDLIVSEKANFNRFHLSPCVHGALPCVYIYIYTSAYVRMY